MVTVKKNKSMLPDRIHFVKEKYTFFGNISKKIKDLVSQNLLYCKGHLIVYQVNFKWFDLMITLKRYAHFHEGWWKQPGLFLHPLRLTAFCLYVIAQELIQQIKRTKGTVQAHYIFKYFEIKHQKSKMHIFSYNLYVTFDPKNGRCLFLRLNS